MGSHFNRASGSIELTVHVDNTETYTTVLADDGEYVGIGTAKRNPADEYDRVSGQKIAGARALADLASVSLAAALAESEEEEADE